MNKTSGPLISVIVPAYYSFTTIESSLNALMLQTYRDFEVIVVNSSPEEQTGRIVREGFPNVKFIQSPERLLPHAARNVGIDIARGDLLVFTDPDCVADKEWLETLVGAFEGGRKAVVGSMGLAGTGWLEYGIHLCKFHPLLPGLSSSKKTCAPTANAAYCRDLWESIGPFPGEVFAGDGIISWRASSLGQAPFFIPKAVVRHFHKEIFGSFCRQRFSRGREYALVRLKLLGPPTILTWLSLVFSWAVVGWVLLRAGKNAISAGWGRMFFLTLPVQLAGHLMWALGESFEAVGILFRTGFAGGRDA
jgi:GT2 family glycosyltransferase